MTTPAPMTAAGNTFTPDVLWALEDIGGRAPRLSKRRRYYEGHHDTMLPPGKTLSRNLRDLLEDLSDNLCDDVVDEPVGRLQIINITGTSPGLGQAAWDWWTANKGPARSREVHRNAWGLGDGYCMVQEAPDGIARLYVQQPEQIAVRYSRELPDLIELVGKLWRDGKRYRLNLYYAADPGSGAPAKVERWATRGVGQDGAVPGPKAFIRLADGGDAEPWMEIREDWAERLPIFHFPADEVGRYGRSVLTDVINLQDVLNKSCVDLVVAMEDVALPQRYGTGIQVEIGEDGQEKPLFRKSSSEQMLRTASHEARFGQFDGADLTQFLKVQESYRAEIARKGYLPLHSVSLDTGGQPPSGIALLVSEGRQIKRVQGGQQDWEQTWLEVIAEGLTRNGTACTADDLALEWGPAETRDERALVETLALKVDLGLPKREALLEAGYDEDDVDEWMDEAAQQADAISGGRASMPGAGLPTMVPPAPQGPAGAPQPAAPAA